MRPPTFDEIDRFRRKSESIILYPVRCQGCEELVGLLSDGRILGWLHYDGTLHCAPRKVIGPGLPYPDRRAYNQAWMKRHRSKETAA